MSSIPDQKTIDDAIARAEPILARAQFNKALERLREEFEKRLEDDVQSGRALTEKVHLIAGNRRTKAVNVEVERRAQS